ncbi:dihydrofolate reductase family protein [Agromyces sp. MMS24-K17]|uniref:dihydrofolate reductase family protein n=1 Tax=Agromyces sp. MMS24-K17 TaxID=3372850 RepID=UPI003754FDCD
MGRLILEQIVSADGYAADAEGGIDYFGSVDRLNADDHDQLALLETVDRIVLGRATYEMFAAYWPAADAEVERVAVPIARLPKHVVSTTLDRAPWGDDEIGILRDLDAVAELRELDGSTIVWGSLDLADDLLRAGLVDVLRLRILPVLIGAGRSFTPGDLGERRLAFHHAVEHPGGQVTLQYEVR